MINLPVSTWFVLVLVELAHALPFVTTWRTTEANEAIVLPPIYTPTTMAINWGDASPLETLSTPSNVSPNHTYATPGLYTVSIEGQIYWYLAQANKTTTAKLMDIASWGDGFLVNSTRGLFKRYANLQVSAPPHTQPVFLPGASLEGMFAGTSFNSTLDWDLSNVTVIIGMFADTPLNQPITFRNTQGVERIDTLFSGAAQFNQPFHFDAPSVTSTLYMFADAYAFNQVVNLSNSRNLWHVGGMFLNCFSFNSPIFLNTDSVTMMSGMFKNATSFNQPVTFNTSLVDDIGSMFYGAANFNQPINFNTPALKFAHSMFFGAARMNQPVVMNMSLVASLHSMFSGATSFASTVSFTSTADVVNMSNMFSGALYFEQDLSGWDTQKVVACPNFCPWCGLPSFPLCTPCPVMKYTTAQNVSVCNNGTRAPSVAPPPTPSGLASAAASFTLAPLLLLALLF